MNVATKCIFIITTLTALAYIANGQELSAATDVIPCVVIVRRCQSNCSNAPYDIVRWSFHILEGSAMCEKIDGRSPQAVNFVRKCVCYCFYHFTARRRLFNKMKNNVCLYYFTIQPLEFV